MAIDIDTLENPIMRAIGPVAGRHPQLGMAAVLPKDFELVTADSHWEITEDIFFQQMPDHLRDRAPRVWFDRYWHVAQKAKPVAASAVSGDAPEGLAGVGDKFEKMWLRGLIQEAWDVEFRTSQLKAEGIHKEIAFPQSLMFFSSIRDLELREGIYRIYNEFVAEKMRKFPSFIGVGILSNWWEPEKAESAVQQIKRLGLKTFMIPFSVKDADGKEVSLASPKMDALWSAVEAGGIPLNFHVGESVTGFEERGGIGANVCWQLAPFRKPLGQLIFGGVFDRHPSLQVVFSEGGLSWIAPFLQDAEMVYDSYTDLLDPIKHRPSYYWHNNCYGTFQSDLLGLSQLHLIGADRVMWGSDYPHSEGTFGFSRDAVQDVLRATNEKEARLILGDTARKLYSL